MGQGYDVSITQYRGLLLRDMKQALVKHKQKFSSDKAQ